MTPPIYFPFVDQALGFDCISCGGRCCKKEGGGFSLTAVELAHLDETFGGVSSLAHATRTRDYFAIPTTGSQCIFLDVDQSCRVHRSCGYEAKPLLCRLFPANQYFLLQSDDGASVLVVDINPLCPIECIPQGRDRGHRQRPIQGLIHQHLHQQVQSHWQLICQRAVKLALPCDRRELQTIIEHEETCRDLALSETFPNADHDFRSLIEGAFLRERLHLVESAKRACQWATPRFRFLMLRQLAEVMPIVSAQQRLHALWPRIATLWAHLLSARSALSRRPATVADAYDVGAHEALTLWFVAQADHLPQLEDIEETDDTMPVVGARAEQVGKWLAAIYAQSAGEGGTIASYFETAKLPVEDRLFVIRALPWKLLSHLRMSAVKAPNPSISLTRSPVAL